MVLKITKYPEHLQALTLPQYLGKYLDESSKSILINNAQLLNAKIEKIKKGPVEWDFNIERKKPLRFLMNNSKLEVDISCNIKGSGDDIKEQSMELRIWSYDDKICFRDDVDSASIKEKIRGSGCKRVILRFHIDLRNPDVTNPEPIHHLQIGGISEENEYCWFPKQIDVPRFPHPPMDIILICEFVMLNFFPDEYLNLRNKPEWKHIVMYSEDIFLKNYFKKYSEYIEKYTKTINKNKKRNMTLLDNLIAVTN